MRSECHTHFRNGRSQTGLQSNRVSRVNLRSQSTNVHQRRSTSAHSSDLRVGLRLFTNNKSSAISRPIVYIATTSLKQIKSTQQVHRRAFASASKDAIQVINRVDLGGIAQFKLADIGEGIAEVEVLKWHVKEGDKIKQFDLICEVQSDKATVEIKSRYDGIVKKLHYNKGDMAKVGTVLMDIQVEGAEATPSTPSAPSPSSTPKETQPQPSSSTEASSPAPTPTKLQGKVLATPAVRYLARKHQIDLSTIRGSGRDGRIHKEDILSVIQGGPTAKPQVPPSMPSIIITEQDRVVPLSGYSRIMAKTMAAAAHVPLFGYCDEIHMDSLLRLRQELKPIVEKRGIKFTYMPIIIKATSMALSKYPRLNSSFDEATSSLVLKASHNIGIAMDTPNGLVVPNIKNVQSKSLFEIAQELNRLHNAGKEANISREDLSGGTFSLSNIGNIGGTYTSPVLLLPEVAIGAFGRIHKVPRYDNNGNIVPAHIMNVSWSADHRVIDGATMANFSNLWKSFLENPQLMLLDSK